MPGNKKKYTIYNRAKPDSGKAVRCSENYLQGLSANEKALLESIPLTATRKLAANIIRLKKRLQFTGWLQYIIPLVLMFPVAVVGGILILLNFQYAAYPFLGAAAVIVIISIFDLITVKFCLRFSEPRPARRDHLDTSKLLKTRRSCRSYQTKKISDDDREELMSYIQTRSLQNNLDAKSIRFEYIAAPITVWPVVNASEFIVAIAPKEYNRSNVIGIGKCLQEIVIDASSAGLGTCWIGPGADQSSIVSCLGNRFNPDKDHIVCLCAVGYRSKYVPLFLRVFNTAMRRRLPLSDLFYSDNNFSQPLNFLHNSFSELESALIACQWAPSSFNGQTTRAVLTINQDKVQRVDFYTTTKSRYYALLAAGIWAAHWKMECEKLAIKGEFFIPSIREEDVKNIGPGKPVYCFSWQVESS